MITGQFTLVMAYGDALEKAVAEENYELAAQLRDQKKIWEAKENQRNFDEGVTSGPVSFHYTIIG